MLRRLLKGKRGKGKRHDGAARLIYARIVEQARKPEFYRVWGVPDTVDGRFEMIALHAFLVLHRLKREGEVAADLAQALFDVLFVDMDVNLRELGVGDLGVGRRVRAMAEGLYGRIAAYETGLEEGPETLAAALARNLYGTVEPDDLDLRSMSAYVSREVGQLAAQGRDSLIAGRLDFGAPPEGGARGRRPAPDGLGA